jgi:hypothetical protein
VAGSTSFSPCSAEDASGLQHLMDDECLGRGDTYWSSSPYHGARCCGGKGNDD